MTAAKKVDELDELRTQWVWEFASKRIAIRPTTSAIAEADATWNKVHELVDEAGEVLFLLDHCRWNAGTNTAIHTLIAQGRDLWRRLNG